MADRTLQILPGGQSPAPFVYTVPASTSFTLLGVKATFDGSAAVGNFLPCVQLVSDAGVVMAFGLGESVAAGGSADVSFAPFLRPATAAVTGGGIQFDTYPQAGGWLYAETNHVAGTSPNNYGIELHDFSAGGFGVGIIADVNDIQVEATDIEINQFSAPSVALGAIDSKLIMSSGGGVELAAGLDSGTAPILLRAATNLSLNFNDGGGGGTLRIRRNGSVMFEFRADGSVHGLAAVGAITWDL